VLYYKHNSIIKRGDYVFYMKTIKKSELRELVKTKSLYKIAEMYGVTYERIRQICVMWDIPRRGWNRMAKIELINDEKKAE